MINYNLCHTVQLVPFISDFLFLIQPSLIVYILSKWELDRASIQPTL